MTRSSDHFIPLLWGSPHVVHIGGCASDPRGHQKPQSSAVILQALPSWAQHKSPTWGPTSPDPRWPPYCVLAVEGPASGEWDLWEEGGSCSLAAGWLRAAWRQKRIEEGRLLLCPLQWGWLCFSERKNGRLFFSSSCRAQVSRIKFLILIQ